MILEITLELIINLEIIWRRVGGLILTNISPSNIFWKSTLLERYHQKCEAFFGYTGINRVTSSFTMKLTDENAFKMRTPFSYTLMKILEKLFDEIYRFAMISVWSIIETKERSFSIMFSAHIVKGFIQKEPYLPWKPCVKVKNHYDKDQIWVSDHSSSEIYGWSAIDQTMASVHIKNDNNQL